MLCRQNQALERDWQSMLDEKFRLQQESKALSQHLNALLNDKFGPQINKGFDADTPIDKTLAFIQFIIAVCFWCLLLHQGLLALHCWTGIVAHCSLRLHEKSCILLLLLTVVTCTGFAYQRKWQVACTEFA